jgi:hypothetical protein
MIFNTHDFRFIEKSVTGSLTTGEYTYEQQTDHQATIGGSLIDPDNNNVITLDETNYMAHRDFFDQYGDPSIYSNNTPYNWTEFGDQIYFNCPVNKNYTFVQRYYRTPTPMSAGTDVPDVPETFRELLELWADYRGEKYRGNHDIAATYKQEFEDELENMVIKYSPVTGMGPTIARQTRRRV